MSEVVTPPVADRREMLDVLAFLPNSAGAMRHAIERRHVATDRLFVRACTEMGLRRGAELSVVQRARLASAPLVHALVREPLRPPDEIFAPMLARWVSVELGRAGERADGAAGWSALGDVCVDPAVPEVLASSPVVAGIVIDGCSPIASALPFLSPHARASATAAMDVDADADAIRMAFASIAAIDEAALALVSHALSVVVVYDLIDDVHGFSSSSSARYPGMAGLANARDRYRSLHDVTDALVHEAVHSYLYAVEDVSPFYDRDNRLVRSFTSPWSGANLALHSFVHACFVWYSLAVFWRLALARDIHDADAAESLARRAEGGFFGSEFHAAIGSVADLVEPTILATLRRLPSLLAPTR